MLNKTEIFCEATNGHEFQVIHLARSGNHYICIDGWYNVIVPKTEDLQTRFNHYWTMAQIGALPIKEAA